MTLREDKDRVSSKTEDASQPPPVRPEFDPTDWDDVVLEEFIKTGRKRRREREGARET